MLDLLRGRHELAENLTHRARAEQPGLLRAARGEDARREDVPALIVRGELHLVDGQEFDLALDRHRLDGRDPVGRPRGDALLLAGHERDPALADARRDAVVDLAREQPQREPDHARRVLEHALDGAMRLAGVRRAEQRRDRAA